jgi:hypothetical protein
MDLSGSLRQLQKSCTISPILCQQSCLLSFIYLSLLSVLSLLSWICKPYLPTYLRSWALLEKLPIVQLLKNFPAFYGTRKFIIVFTRALHWSLSWDRSIQSILSQPISLRSILISQKTSLFFQLQWLRRVSLKNRRTIGVFSRVRDDNQRLISVANQTIGVITGLCRKNHAMSCEVAPLIRGYKNSGLENVHHLCTADSGLSFVLAKRPETGQGVNFYIYTKNKQKYPVLRQGQGYFPCYIKI